MVVAAEIGCTSISLLRPLWAFKVHRVSVLTVEIITLFHLTVKEFLYKVSVYFHNMLPILQSALENIGLHEKQTAVLGVLLESGSPMYVSAIARAAKLNRTTVYDVLKELSAKGLASQVKKEGAVRYQAIAAELLPAYVERRREALEESKRQLAEIVPQIKLLRSKGKALPKVQFFEGKEGVMQAYEDTLENNKEKILRDITGIDAVFSTFDAGWIEYYLNKRTRLGIRCTDLVPDTAWGRKSADDDKKYIRETKFLPAKFGFGAEVSIYDNKVGIFSYAQENPVAVIIEDDTISDMMKSLFDFMERHASTT